MSSDTSIETLLRHGPRHRTGVSEFLHALGQGHAYDPLRNSYVLFGFLWGLPVPLFSMGLDLWFSGHPSVLRCLSEHPIHLFFLLHPFLFAAVFGAMGAVRQKKDRQIAHLLDALKTHIRELAQANDRLKELDHLKAQFMANVTHELKTPLVAIRGYNESILEERFGPLTSKQKEGLEVAVRNVERLQKLIDELLEFERIDAGEFRLSLSDFDLVPLVQSALQTLQPEVDRKRLAVRLRLPDALEVHGDRERIAHVLLNLLSNAVKFSTDGAAIGVDAAVGEDDGDAAITVWDRGPGIPTAAQKFLFTRFWQADGSSRRRHGGTGLGLAIVKGILDAHGATLQVISAEGSGTRVRFTLPLAERVGSSREVAP
jgi:signal transduction histidine kinase